MAVISSPINFQRLTKKVDAARKTVVSVGKSIQNISNVVSKRTRIKSEIFNQTKTLRNRRVENERKKQIEDEIEAPDKVTKPGGARDLAQADTSKGFFDRLIGFVGYLAAGWIMNNLPTLIGMGKEFIARLQKAGEILSGFFNNTIQLFSSFGNILGALGQNIIGFDLFDSSNRLRSSFDQLNSAVAGLGSQIEQAFGLITTPLTEGVYSMEKIPGFGTEQQSEGAYETQTSSAGAAGGGQWKPLLDVISAGEGGYESVNPGQVVPGLTEMTIADAWATAQSVGRLNRGSGAMGRYQLLSDPIGRAKKAGLDPYKDIFSPANQDRIAVYILENIRNGKKWLSGTLRGGDAAFAQGIADEWAGVPNLFGQYSYPNQGGKVGAAAIRTALQKVKRGSEVPSGQPQQIEQVPAGKVKPIITSRFGASRGKRSHGGTDLAVDYGTPLRAVADGKIITTNFDPGGWGYYMVYQDSSGLFHLYGHMPRGSYKTSGEVKKGEVIGKVGSTGSSTGPHLHWEIGRSWNGRIGGKFDPLQIYSPNAPFNTPPGPGVAPGAPASFTPAAQQRMSYPSGITPDRRGQDIIITQPPSQQNIITSGGGGDDSGITPATNFAMLNNFIKNKLLLDLAYL